MAMGSGIKDVGPRMPLYTTKASDLTSWSLLGALFDLPNNFSWGGDAFRAGSFGFNVELPGINTLVEKEGFGGDGSTVHYFVNAGTEAGNNSYHPNPHWTMFGLGSVSRRPNDSVALDLRAVAPLD